jgi:hypothetical protein
LRPANDANAVRAMPRRAAFVEPGKESVAEIGRTQQHDETPFLVDFDVDDGPPGGECKPLTLGKAL